MAFILAFIVLGSTSSGVTSFFCMGGRPGDKWRNRGGKAVAVQNVPNQKVRVQNVPVQNVPTQNVLDSKRPELKRPGSKCLELKRLGSRFEKFHEIRMIFGWFSYFVEYVEKYPKQSVPLLVHLELCSSPSPHEVLCRCHVPLQNCKISLKNNVRCFRKKLKQKLIGTF